MGSTRLTEARRRALAVLAHGEATGHTVRVSNATTDPDQLDGIGPATSGVDLTIYWQTAEWLAANSYVTSIWTAETGERLTLTDAGRQLIAKGGR